MQLTANDINEIADYLSMGMVCFIHKKTHKIIYRPDDSQFYETEGWEDVIEELEKNEDSYVRIEKMSSHESFIIMKRFIDEVADESIKKRLTHALEKNKPFHNFKYEIDQLDEERDQWFKFKSDQYNKWVEQEIKFSLNDDDNVDDDE